MKSLVIGQGQIGMALHQIFSGAHECRIRDVLVEANDPMGVEVLHIAYPYSENFVEHTLAYIEWYKPRLTIIHSSVAVGTTDLCGPHVVHAPERGRYPNLAQEMAAFTKFVGGRQNDDRELARDYFAKCKWPVVLVDDPSWTELVKLLSNAHLGLEIAWRQEVRRIAKSFGLHGHAVYNAWEDSYNRGHMALGHKQLVRPTVRPDPIGGHCILPCIDILSEQFSSEAFEFIRRSNAKREAEERSGDGRPGVAAAEALAKATA